MIGEATLFFRRTIGQEKKQYLSHAAAYSARDCLASSSGH